jgi:hypothetical protein
MSVQHGTRPGSKPTETYPGWDYIKSDGPGWQEIRKNEREVMRWEGEINKAQAAVDKAALALRMAFVFLHGGHVERGSMARSEMRSDMEPAQVLAQIMNMLPKNVPALLIKK